MGKENGLTDEQKLGIPGPAAFSILRAEDEPWLEACFVPPPEFGRMVGPRSVIVFGGPSRLTAETPAASLCVSWSPGALLLPPRKPARGWPGCNNWRGEFWTPAPLP